MSAVASREVDTIGRIGDIQNPLALTGDINADNARTEKTRDSSDSLSFFDNWHAQLVALGSENTTSEKEIETQRSVPLPDAQNLASIKADLVASKDGPDLIRGQNALLRAVFKTESGSQSTHAVPSNAAELVSGPIYASDRTSSRHRSKNDAPKSQTRPPDEGSLSTQLIPVVNPLAVPNHEVHLVPDRAKSLGTHSSNTERTANSTESLRGSVYAKLALPFEKLAMGSLSDAAKGQKSAVSEDKTAAGFRADIGPAIQESKDAQAAIGSSNSAVSDIEIRDDVHGGAATAGISMPGNANNSQFLTPPAQRLDSASSHTSDHLNWNQSTTSQMGEMAQKLRQNSSNGARPISNPGNDESVRAQQSLPLARLDELDDAHRKPKRPEATSDYVIQKQELNNHNSSSATDSTSTGPTLSLQSSAAGSTAIPLVSSHTSVTDRSGVQETINALDAGPGNESRALTWTHAGRTHAEVGYQDPSLGWVGVRAEVSGGAVHATVVPQSSEAAQVLGRHLHGLHTYLSENRTPVETLSLAGFSGDARQMPGQGSGQGSHHGTRDQGGESRVLEQTSDGRPAVGTSTNSVEREASLVAAIGSRYISVVV